MTPSPDIEAEVARAVAKAMEPILRENTQLRESAERLARFAKEDAERLARTVQEASERKAEDVVKIRLKETFDRIGIDADKPEKFITTMDRVRKFFDDVDSARKHAIFAFIGAVMLAITAGFWQTIKAGILKP